jgi:hypothetical protein
MQTKIITFLFSNFVAALAMLIVLAGKFNSKLN